MLIEFASRPRRRKEVKGGSRAKQDEFVSYDDVPDSNCDNEDIGEPVTKKSKRDLGPWNYVWNYYVWNYL
jgi:hypothetical protein